MFSGNKTMTVNLSVTKTLKHTNLPNKNFMSIVVKDEVTALIHTQCYKTNQQDSPADPSNMA